MPWEGRRFEPTAYSSDDGSAPAALADALRAFRRGDVDAGAVVDAVRGSRLLIPLVASLGDSASGDHGVLVDKSADLAIVTVSGPDGRAVMPVFSSVGTMMAWNPQARPVPTDAVRVALAAASEDTDLVVLDPTAPTEFVVRRPALWAIAQSTPWVPGWSDSGVIAAFEASVSEEPFVLGIAVEDGDPAARLAGPEVIVRIALVDGVDEVPLAALIARLQERWTLSEAIALRVDSLAVSFGRSARPAGL